MRWQDGSHVFGVPAGYAESQVVSELLGNVPYVFPCHLHCLCRSVDALGFAEGILCLNQHGF
jgi:hypothetical protein